MKERLQENLAKAAVIAGVAGSILSWTVDVASCPGEVEHPKDTPALVCDEDSGSDDLINNPGTPEQKLLYLSILTGALGGAALALSRRRRGEGSDITPRTST